MKIAVYCGSSNGNEAIYAEAAKHLGQRMAEQKIDLVYGGARVGLMGTVADSVLEHGGQVFGVMPQILADKELAHQGLTELFIVQGMHKRKQKMSELADAFIALPGGVGTMEELFEVWTWAQLGYHHKPCCLLSANGYYDHLLTFADQMVKSGFMGQTYREMLQVSDSPEVLLDNIASYQAPANKWS